MIKSEDELIDVEEAAIKEFVPGWELAGIRRALGWAPGKLVTEEEFKSAVKRFRNRPQGGGELCERSING